MSVETTRQSAAMRDEVPAETTGPTVAPRTPGTAPRGTRAPGALRPVSPRPVSLRPGGRRGGPGLPPVRPRVAAGGARPRTAAVPLAVAHRRRRVAAAVLGLLLAVLVGLAVVLAGGGAAGAVPAPTTVTVVGAGESLSDVAHRAAPGADTDAVVDRIRELNGLSSSGVATGRPLVVPAG